MKRAAGLLAGAFILFLTWGCGCNENKGLAPPKDLRAYPLFRAVSLTWQPSSSTSATGYNVYLSPSSGGMYTKVGNTVSQTTSYTVLGLVTDTTFYFVVRAVGNRVESANSNETSVRPYISISPPPPPPPPPPPLPNITLLNYDVADPPPGGNNNGQVNPGETVALQITLTNSAGTAYTVTGTLSTSTPGVTVNPPNTASYGTIPTWGNGSGSFTVTVANTVPVGTWIWFTLSVSANGGTYSTSVWFWIQVMAPPPPPPQPPQNLTATPGNGLVTLTWNASSGATGYNISACTTYSPVATTTGTSIQITGLVNGTSYCYVVCAYNAYGISGPSNQATATPTASAPSAPTLTAASPSTTSVVLTWTTVAGATGYRVFMGTSSGSYSFFTNTTGTVLTVTALSPMTTYFFVVTAVNASGESAYSNERSATPLPNPCGAFPTDYILITRILPTPGTSLTTGTLYTFTLTTCYTLTATSGYVAISLFTQGSFTPLSSFSQPVTQGSGTVSPSLGSVILPQGSTLVRVGVTLSDVTGFQRGYDFVTYSVDGTNYFRVINSVPLKGTTITTGANTFTLTISYNHASISSETLLIVFFDQNFNWIGSTTFSFSGLGVGTTVATFSQTLSCGITTLYIELYSFSTGNVDIVSYPLSPSLCPNITLAGYSITDPAPGGNNNGQVNPGETVALQITLTNIGTGTAYTVTGTLSTFASGVTISPPNPAGFGNILSGGSASASYTVNVSSSVPPGTIWFNLNITANGGSYSTSLFFFVQVASPPCGAGQYFASTPAYSWDSSADPGNGTQIFGTGIDDSSSPVTLPFTFSFYCVSTTTAWVSSNGLLSFIDYNSYFGNVIFPSTDPSAQEVATPYWDDLTTYDTTSEIRWANAGVAPNRRVVITWTNMRYCCGSPGTAAGTFQAILYEGTNRILFQYQAINPGAGSATAGLNRGDGVLYNNILPGSLTAGTAILFSP